MADAPPTPAVRAECGDDEREMLPRGDDGRLEERAEGEGGRMAADGVDGVPLVSPWFTADV